MNEDDEIMIWLQIKIRGEVVNKALFIGKEDELSDVSTDNIRDTITMLNKLYPELSNVSAV